LAISSAVRIVGIRGKSISRQESTERELKEIEVSEDPKDFERAFEGVALPK